MEASPSPVYGAALLMRLGFTPLPGSNPGASAAAQALPVRISTGGACSIFPVRSARDETKNHTTELISTAKRKDLHNIPHICFTGGNSLPWGNHQTGDIYSSYVPGPYSVTGGSCCARIIRTRHY